MILSIFPAFFTSVLKAGAASLGLVEGIAGVQVVKRPLFLSSMREDEFCEFEVDGVSFIVFEPFGDNSRYWVGPKGNEFVEHVAKVREAFESARFGNLLA